jgi:hypothetical protein
LNRAVPRDLETICLKAMAKEPQRRYPTAQEMAVDLRRFLRGEHILARRPGPLMRSVRWVKRRPAMAAALGLALLAAAALAMAQGLATRNRELLGLRTTTLETDPPGARVAFVPLSKVTGEPQFPQVIYASGVSPIEVDLGPGDYLVVAALDDGRFHEVYRHVPGRAEAVPFTYYHRISWNLPDGRLSLPKITIPDGDVTDGMALIAGSKNFTTGIARDLGYEKLERPIASFYLDPTEYTYRDRKESATTDPLETNSPPLDEAMSASYDDAISRAEQLGKRLPTEFEYEYAATAGGRTKFPWGNDFPREPNATEFGPVRTPAFDRLDATPPVFGLCSGKAEWTSSWAVTYSPDDMPMASMMADEYRIVRGGNLETINGDPALTAEARDPRQRQQLLRHVQAGGLGFRCVRSAMPQVAF